MHPPDRPALPPSSTDAPRSGSPAETARPACPVCGGRLMEVKAKLVCSRCRAICETCCEGGPG